MHLETKTDKTRKGHTRTVRNWAHVLATIHLSVTVGSFHEHQQKNILFNRSGEDYVYII
jgi:hypothetical protein